MQNNNDEITFTLDDFDDEVVVDDGKGLLEIEEIKNEDDKTTPNPLPPNVPVKTTGEEKIEVDDLLDPSPSQITLLAKELLGVETIIKADENGEDIEVTLEDANLTAEELVELVNSKRSQEIEEIKTNSVSVKNLDETQKAIIDIVSKGGNIQSLLELQQTYVDPISKLDLDKEKDQVEALYLHGKASGKTDEDIELIVEGLKTRGTLREKAEEAINALHEAVKNETLKQQAIAQEKIEATEKALKDYKKDLKVELKENFKSLNDVSVTKLHDFASKKKEDGKIEMDITYLKMRSDAKLAPKLALFLYDIEEYNKLITTSAPIKEAIKTEQKLRLGRLSTGSQGSKSKFQESKSNELSLEF